MKGLRDRLTLTLYTSFITWGWFLYGFSPAVPLIAIEQGISRGQAGLHGTAMALGTIVSGLVSSPLALRVGRRTATLLGCAAMVLGIAVLVTAGALPGTLLGCFITAVGGSLTIAAAQPALIVHAGRAGAAAISEANGVGSGFGLLAPLALGLSVGLGWGWRPAVAVTAVLAVAGAVLISRLPATGPLGRGTTARRVIPAQGVVDPQTTEVGTVQAVEASLGLEDAAGSAGALGAEGALPAPAAGPSEPAHRSGFGVAFWLFWCVLLCAVAIENATTFWAADLLVGHTGASAALASASVSALVIGMTVSRFIVGPISVHKSPEKLLLVAFALAGAGWALFWLATVPWLAVVGLALAGLGYGAHYPLSVTLTMRASDGRPDQAQARASMGVGFAVGIAPFALGAVADQIGSHQAFLLVPALILAGAACVSLGLRAVRRDPHHALTGHDDAAGSAA